jgi:osmotically-inducible protein OsmY
MSDDDHHDEAGSRDLRYGHAFGTQRDRSEGEEGYLETGSDAWTEVPSKESLGPEEQRRADRRIEAEARERLAGQDRLCSSNIEVRVERGAVVLAGRVEDAEVRQLAEDALGGVSGVKAIYNQLHVRSNRSGNTSPDNDEITEHYGEEARKHFDEMG